MTDPGPFISQFASTARRMIAQTGEVLKNAAPLIQNNQYTADQFVKSMIQLADIAALGGIEMAENALAGPSAPLAPIMISSDVQHAAQNLGTQRILSISRPFARATTVDYIPNSRITFDPPHGTDPAKNPLGILAVGATDFRVRINTADLPSGVYTGQVTAQPVGSAATETVEVVIAL